MEPCKLCNGTGKNTTRIKIRVNNDLCPRCGGYGTISCNAEDNHRTITQKDKEYIQANEPV